MCRNIRPLFNFDPPATDAELEAAALQFARKLSGMPKPTLANQAAIDAATYDFTQVARRLLDSLVTSAGPKDRETEAQKAKLRSTKRFGSVS
jgi:hypothetical protein